ncbi:MAG TPA: DMT family transporter [Candidatus Fraserbacteria bacterium]|nr:DMT family transporter [Candidatus Fraserbacteria bacterium]
MNRIRPLPTPLQRPALAGPRGIAPGDLARLTLVTFLWALCFPLIAAGFSLSGAPPLYFAALRSLVAGAGLLLPAFALRRPLPRGRGVWLGLLGVGLSTTSLGFGGMFLAGGVVSPGVATVLANTQPLIAAGLAYFALGERLGPRRRVGLALGFTGILLVALPGFGAEGANSTPIGVGYVLLGALGVALGNVLLKRLVGQVDLLMAAGWQFLLGSVPLLLAAQLFEAPLQVTWSLPFVADLLTLGLMGTALAFALWFSLLHRGELTRLNTFTFLTTVFALIIGAIFFRESLSLEEIGGIVLTLVGVVWVSRASAPQKRIERDVHDNLEIRREDHNVI